jgi:hypothetical protein
MGFAAYWRWKSRSPGGRPRIAKEVRDLIRRMSLENPLWGATKIHGELLSERHGDRICVGPIVPCSFGSLSSVPSHPSRHNHRQARSPVSKDNGPSGQITANFMPPAGRY